MCGSSQFICIKHFRPEDYRVLNGGKGFELKVDAVPTVFDIFLMEVDDEDDASQNNDSVQYENLLELQNAQLNQELEQTKRQAESLKIFMTSRVTHYKNMQKQATHEIHTLRKQVRDLKATLDEYKKEKEESRAKLTVIFHFFVIFNIHSHLLCRTRFCIGKAKRNHRLPHKWCKNKTKVFPDNSPILLDNALP